jgi:hypothetical protein
MSQSLTSNRRRLAIWCSCLALAVGTGVTAWLLLRAETFISVTGAIAVDGKPLQSGMVTFYPIEARGNTYPRSTVGMIKDGTYVLLTYGKKGTTQRGVPPGWYRVVVEGYVATSEGKPRAHTLQFKLVSEGSDKHERIWTPGLPGDPNSFFSNYDKPLSVEVSESKGAQTCDLMLHSPSRNSPARGPGAGRGR